jgi:5'-nucleotidase
MKILLVNDDGYEAPGIRILFESLQDIAEVDLVAPFSQRSGFSMGLTVFKPLTVKEFELAPQKTGYAVSGTPVDCVKLGLSTLLKDPPDLVISGINLGANISTNIFYSGTVGAAMEAAMYGINALAISLDTHTNPDFMPTVEFTIKMVQALHKKPYGGIVFHGNVPALPFERIRGIRLAHQGTMKFKDGYTEISSEAEDRSYQFTGAGISQEASDPEHSDWKLLKQGYITVTLLGQNWTLPQLNDFKFIEQL